MSVMVIYKSSSEHSRVVTDFLYDFERRTTKTLEEIDPDSRRGISLCELYDVYDFPTIIAVNENGQLQKQWRGVPLPTIDELSFYA